MLRVSVLELPARWADPDAALHEVDALLSAEPTDLAIVPEMSFVGYVSPDGEFDLTRFAEPLDGPTVRSVAALCRRHRAHLVAPLVLADDGEVFNAAVIVAPDGAVIGSYRKRHPWFPEQWATPGLLPHPVVDIGGLRVTVAICYDGHFLRDDAADVLANVDLLVFTSAWVDEEETRVPLLRSLAETFGMSVANANWGPGVVVVPGQGGSCIFDAGGRTLAEVPAGGRSVNAVVARRVSKTLQGRARTSKLDDT